MFSALRQPDNPAPRRAAHLVGEEVRQFYENLMKDDKGQDLSRGSREHHNKQRSRESSRRVRRRVGAAETQRGQTHSVAQRGSSGVSESNQERETSISERSMELLGLRLLRCAHEGDVSGLKELLSKGVDINFQDTYFWTAVMCASWSGQRPALRLLLQHGAAWVGVVDTQGRDARDLAKEAGHSEVLEELENYGRSSTRDTLSDSSAPQWCSVCCSEYRSSLSSHVSSTLHQFSLRVLHPHPTTASPSSNSYKMMVRCGWKPGTGLGPEGEGPKQPVPTVLKRDQQGLGYGQIKGPKLLISKPGIIMQ